MAFGEISLKSVKPKIRIPPIACHILMVSPKMVTEIKTATNGSALASRIFPIPEEGV